MMKDRGSLANPAVALRDIIRGEARKISRMQDQITMGVVTNPGDGIDVEVLIDGFGAGPLTALWCTSGNPEVDQRVVLASLTGSQKFFVISVAGQSGEFGAGSSFGRAIFNGNGSFIKAGLPGLRAVTVKCQGGGGGGGGRRANPNGGGAGGGGGGGYGESFILAKDLPDVVAVTRGTAGVGAYNANGTNGGFSDFGGLVSGNGGLGGVRTQGVNATANGGNGGVAVGDIDIPGSAGGAGRWNSAIAGGSVQFSSTGAGGESFMGNAGNHSPQGQTGQVGEGKGYGAGGSGIAGSSATSGGGGQGAIGIVIVDLHF